MLSCGQSTNKYKPFDCIIPGLPPVSSIWIPWLFHRTFPWLSLTSRRRSDGYRVKSRVKRGKILFLQPLDFYENMPRNQTQTLGHLSQIIFLDFPWLSTKNIEITWLSRRSKFSLIFPDADFWFELNLSKIGELIYLFIVVFFCF